MKKNYILLFALLSVLGISAQAIYNGNGNSGFGGTLGGATLTLNDDGTTVTATFNKGAGDLTNVVVIYFDTKSGGFADTSTLTDAADGGRRAISSWDGGQGSRITFPTGFEADYALTFSNNFSALFELDATSHTFIDGANLSPSGDPTTPSYTLSFDFSEIGITATDSFDFVVTYISDTAYLSNEVIGSTSSITPDGGGTNPGFTGFINFDVAEIYDSVLSNEFFNASDIKVFATPNKSINIHGLRSEATVRVYDVLGKEVLMQTISENQVNLSASYLKAGVYIVKLDTAYGSRTKKIVLN